MKQPNVLFILSDDQGSWAMGCSGNTDLKTPHLDALAASGVRFDNFYCASPVCSPARVSLLSGKIPSATGVHDWLAKGQCDTSALSDEIKAQFALPESEMNPDYVWPKTQLDGDEGIEYLKAHKTFPEVLHDAGYQCALSGKWHAGAANRPQCGFADGWYTCAMGGQDYYHAVMLEDGKMVMKDGEYVTDLITDRAVDFLDKFDKERPFCLCVHYSAPHSPWAAECHPKKYIDMYDGLPYDSVPNDPPHPWVAGVDVPFAEWKKKPHKGVRFIHANYAPIRETWQEYRQESIRGYYAAVTAMDDAIGRLLGELERRGLRDNTLVVFTSDNGSNMGHHGIFGKGNGTYPPNMYATSVKVPGLFSCPGKVRAGVVSHANASHYDVYETVLDFCGVPYTQTADMPGRSFCKLLCDKSVSDEIDGDAYVFDEYGATRMVCDGRRKLVRRTPAGFDEFYDLEKDPGEYRNEVDNPAYAAEISALDAKLEAFYARYVNPEFDGRKEQVKGKGQLTPHDFIQ